MPIVHEYRPPASVRARAEYIGAGAIAQEDQRRFLSQQAEQARQFDLDYEYRLDQSALQNQLQRSQLAQDQYQFNAASAQQFYQQNAQNQLQWAGLGQDANQFDARMGLQQQQMDQDAWQIEQDAAARQAQAGAMVEQQRMKLAAAQQQKVEERNMSQAIRAQEAIHKYPNFTSQAQYDAAVQGWEQKFGMDWDFPQRAIAEQQQLDGQTKRNNYINGIAALTGLSPDEVGGLVVDTEAGPQLALPPQVVAGIAQNRMDNQRQRDLKTQDITHEKETKAAEFEISQTKVRHEYAEKVQATQAAAIAKYNKLLAAAAKAASDTGGAGDISSLPEETKKRLWMQALQEHPKPPAPPGLQP